MQCLGGGGGRGAKKTQDNLKVFKLLPLTSAGEMMSLESLTDKLVQALLLKSQPLKTSKGWLLAG